MSDSTNLQVTPLLAAIAEQAPSADQSRSVDATLLASIRKNDIMTFTAAKNIGGKDASCLQVGRELQAIAANCASTAWVLWNHLATFHLFAGLLGPGNSAFLKQLVAEHQWVCFPAGASTAIQGVAQGEQYVLSGKGAFGSGGRYADYAGASFVVDDRKQPQFGLIDLHQPQVEIDADWYSLSLRASATDTVKYNGALVDKSCVVEFPMMYREKFRQAERQMIAPRYREDWVALSDLWLGLMAVGVVQANLDEVCAGIRERVAIMGVKVAQRPLVQVNLGQAQANLNAARDTVNAALTETDERIATHTIPTEDDYLRQVSAAMAALQLADQAMSLLVRVMGGNGLREGHNFRAPFS